MADRPSINTVGAGATYSTTLLNNNFQALRDWFDHVLGTSGTGGTANSMQGDLDLNGYRLRNATLDAGDLVIANTGEINTASNLGSGEGVFYNKSGVDLRFKSLIAGSNITLTSTATDITIDASVPANGEANTASNLGATGSSVYSGKVGVDLQFRKLIGGTNVTLTQNTNDITINAVGLGEVNTASNVGTGDGILFKGKSGVDLQFKRLIAGTNITITNGTNDVTIAAAGSVGEANTASNVGAGTATLFYQKSGVDLQFKTLIAGTGIALTNSTDTVTITNTGTSSLDFGTIASSITGNTAQVLDYADPNKRIRFQHAATVPDQIYTFEIYRNATYAGQVHTPGFVNGALRVESIAGQTGSNGGSYEWGITSNMTVNATDASQNVAIYGRTVKAVSRTGGTWAGCLEVKDTTNGQTGAIIGLEVDLKANGANGNFNRVGIDVVSVNSAVEDGGTGTAPTITYGVRVGPQNGDSNNGGYSVGYAVTANVDPDVATNTMTCATGFMVNANGTRGFWDRGTKDAGVVLSGTYALGAITIPANQYITLNGTNTIKFRYESSANRIQFYNGSTKIGFINTNTGSATDVAFGTGGGGSSNAFSGVLAYDSGTTNNIASGGQLNLVFGSESYDTSSYFTPGGSTITIPSGITKARFAFNLETLNLTTAQTDAKLQVILVKNGATSNVTGGFDQNIGCQTNVSTKIRGNGVSSVVSCTAGDTFECRVINGTGVTVTLSGANNGVWFSCEGFA